MHEHLLFSGLFHGCFSGPLSEAGGCTTTCIVMAPPGNSPTVTLDSANDLLFSRIFPALIKFISLIVLGLFSFPLGHCARILSFKFATIVAGAYLLGPMSVQTKFYFQQLSKNHFFACLPPQKGPSEFCLRYIAG